MQLVRRRVAGGTLPRSASRTASGSPSPKTHGVPEGLCRFGQPGGCAVRALGERRVCATAGAMSAVVRRSGWFPPRTEGQCQRKRRHSTLHPEGCSTSLGDVGLLSEESWWSRKRATRRFRKRTRRVYSASGIRAKPKFAQPEVWPTPAGRTGLDRMTNRRDNRQHDYASARAATKVCCNPVVVGPRTDEPVRLAEQVRQNRPV